MWWMIWAWYALSWKKKKPEPHDSDTTTTRSSAHPRTPAVCRNKCFACFGHMLSNGVISQLSRAFGLCWKNVYVNFNSHLLFVGIFYSPIVQLRVCCRSVPVFLSCRWVSLQKWPIGVMVTSLRLGFLIPHLNPAKSRATKLIRFEKQNRRHRQDQNK